MECGRGDRTASGSRSRQHPWRRTGRRGAARRDTARLGEHDGDRELRPARGRESTRSGLLTFIAVAAFVLIFGGSAVFLVLRLLASRAERYLLGVNGAPLSFVWLAILFVTTRRQRAAGKQGAKQLQRQYSTNLRRLRREPSRVLTSSLFWLDDRTWWPYVPVFVGVVAPAERRMGWWRWLLVGSAAHVLATLFGQGVLRRQIRRRRAPARLHNARDVGVSYFVLGVAGALTGYVEPRWRHRSQVAGTAALAVNAAARPTFTELGHLTAFAIGVAASPLMPEGDPYPP